MAPKERDDLSSRDLENSETLSKSPTNSKYKRIWKRAFFKIKVSLMMKKMNKELNLFGTPVLTDDYLRAKSSVPPSLSKNLTLSTALEELKLPCGIFHPSCTFKNIWNFLLIMLLIYTATIMPYRIAFVDPEKHSFWWFLELFIDSLFFLDVIVNINSAYYDSEGQLVKSRKRIFLRYLRTWLIIDTIACFPFNLIEEDDDSRTQTNYNSLLRLARLPRLYRLMRVSRIFKMFKHVKDNELLERIQDYLCLKHSAVRLAKFFITVLVCTHIMSCFWYFSAKLDGFNPETWVVRYGYADKDAGSLYLLSIYWSFATLTTVGYGDISAGTDLEIFFAIIWMGFGLCFFSFTIGSLSSMLSNIDTKENALMNKLAIIDEFAKEASLKRDLKFRLRHAIKYSTEKTGFSWHDKQNIFNELPRQLRYEVAMIMHQGAAKYLKFFHERDPVFVSAIVPFLLHLYVEKEEFVYKQGEHADEIYFIANGKVNFACSNKYESFQEQNSGSYFGDIEVVQSIPRQYNVVAKKNCDLLTMNKNLVLYIKEEFPSIYSEMESIAKQKDSMYRRNLMKKREFVRLLGEGVLDEKSQDEINEMIEGVIRRKQASKQERETKLKSKTQEGKALLMSEIKTNKSHIQELQSMINKHSELIQKMNKGFKQLQESGVINEISIKP